LRLDMVDVLLIEATSTWVFFLSFCWGDMLLN
jgi:hypothetical protein